MRRVRWLILLAGVALSAIGIALTLASNHESNPALAITTGLVVAWAFLGCGFVALSRGETRFGLLLSAVGLSWFLGALGSSNDSVVYSFGQLFWGISVAFFIHALLVFPRGYLETKLVYATVASAYAMLSLGPLLLVLFGGQEDENAPETSSDSPSSWLDFSSAVRRSGSSFAAGGLRRRRFAGCWPPSSPPPGRRLPSSFSRP